VQSGKPGSFPAKKGGQGGKGKTIWECGRPTRGGGDEQTAFKPERLPGVRGHDLQGRGRYLKKAGTTTHTTNSSKP